MWDASDSWPLLRADAQGNDTPQWPPNKGNSAGGADRRAVRIDLGAGGWMAYNVACSAKGRNGAAMPISPAVRKRRILQWCLAPIVVITIGLGWRYPLLGYTVPLVMLTGLVGGLFTGRYVCGHLCPRGSFLDRAVGKVSRRKHIPRFLRRMPLRWAVFAALMGLMAFRIWQRPAGADVWLHLGRVFWLMCVVTTGIAVVLGVLIHPRSWCAFCPMGTMQRAVGGHRRRIPIDGEACIKCRKCEKACPFDLEIVVHTDTGLLADGDCLKCPECIAACPTGALGKAEAATRSGNRRRT